MDIHSVRVVHRTGQRDPALAVHDADRRGTTPVAPQLGYEARCAAPHAFDVMLGSQLGTGAYRALVERNLDGNMVSVSGQLDLVYVPFGELIDPNSMQAELRFIDRDSDFHLLARFLETRVDKILDWAPARRPE